MADAAMAMDAHAMRNAASRVYGERTCVSRRGGKGRTAHVPEMAQAEEKRWREDAEDAEERRG